MKITVASGKGGTGKTTIATNLALSIENAQLLDCDVEEPNSHIFIDLELKKVEDVCLTIPKIDESKCDFCGKCSEFCQYHALAVVASKVLLFPELCHGCGGCKLVCPQDAITEETRVIGVIEGGYAKGKGGDRIDGEGDDGDDGNGHGDGNSNGGLEFYHGVLNVGEPMASPVIKALKKRIDETKNVILDSPPGAACPVIETMQETDYCILVTEPTPFGLHDLKIAVAVVRALELPFGVIINRDGVGDDRVEEYCKAEKIPLLMKIPQDDRIARLYSKGIPFVRELSGWKDQFKRLLDTIEKTIE